MAKKKSTKKVQQKGWKAKPGDLAKRGKAMRKHRASGQLPDRGKPPYRKDVK